VNAALESLPAEHAKGAAAVRWLRHVLRFREVDEQPVAPPPKPVEVISLDSDAEEDDGPRLKAQPSPPASSAAFSAPSHEQKEEESESSDDMSDEGTRLGDLQLVSPVQASVPASVAAAASSSSSSSAAAVSQAAVREAELEMERMADGNHDDDGGLTGMDQDPAPETAPAPAQAVSAPSSPSLASLQQQRHESQMLLEEMSLPEVSPLAAMVEHGPPVVRSPSPPQAVPALPAPLLFDAPAASQPEEKQAVVEMPAASVPVPRAAAAMPSPNSGGKLRASPVQQQAYDEAAQFGSDEEDEDEKEFREEIKHLTPAQTHAILKKAGLVTSLEDTKRYLARNPGVKTRTGNLRPKKDRKKELGIPGRKKKNKRITLQ